MKCLECGGESLGVFCCLPHQNAWKGEPEKKRKKCLTCGELLFGVDSVFCSRTCWRKWETMLEKGAKAWADVTDASEWVATQRGRGREALVFNALAKEIVEIAITWRMPNSKGLPIDIWKWFDGWAKKIGEAKA